ncbi:IscS subfamily cysteine desulfurase [Halobacillus sp. Marseille-P3879]|uniref:IscS subfamily cysteine desulfurase n=1 Tax=Halobacillus TaxID=45667 RepID=UPI000C7E5A51|nr:IscS subfamily cysteine desulfurase [Halobacillus sp. Marseille-P3879]
MRYFDFASTCPMSNEVLQTYIKASKDFYGNTRSLHDAGTKADSLIEHCRTTLAGLMGISQDGLTFTSGGTESNLLAMDALIGAKGGKHVIISAGEHSSIKNFTAKLSRQDFKVSEVSLTTDGTVNLEELNSLIQEDTCLLSIQHVNSDTGSIQPLDKIYEMCQDNNILLHSDCVQSFGKIDIKAVSSLTDSFSISSHKIYGPKGVGALYIRPSISAPPYLPNVTHENGRRPGTLNTPGITAFTTASEVRLSNLSSFQSHIQNLKSEFFQSIEKIKHKVEVIGPEEITPVPIIGLCLKETDGQHVMLEANRRGYCFSTGSACQVRSNGPSPTLLAMGFNEQKAHTFIRISFGVENTCEDVRDLAEDLTDILGH